ncbi:Hypothetical protein FKW44_017532, partial [Caligus rogercresseyi]
MHSMSMAGFAKKKSLAISKNTFSADSVINKPNDRLVCCKDTPTEFKDDKKLSCIRDNDGIGGFNWGNMKPMWLRIENKLTT